mmetsp:Transcript_26259/g.57522  ORF Transcript_26259/g.57522 Transcript_26259/m.57522 type:complete len:562 (+) Transcript_26259:219-1904(+)
MISTEKEENKNKAFEVLATFDTTTASTIEHLFITPIQDAATRATLVISSAGEAIFNTGEYILSPLIAPSPTRRKDVNFGKEEERRPQTPPKLRPVDIQPRRDGTGIELIANNDNDNAKTEKVSTLESSIIRGSMLMFDPITAEAENGEMEPMSLKVLRGKNLPFDHTKIRIGVLNREGAVVDQVIGWTPSSEGSRNPIWGSTTCSWTLNANQSTKFLFTLFPEDVGHKRGDQSVTLCAKISAADLLVKRNPNFWIKFKRQDNPCGINNYGRIQIRLTRPTAAKLHAQENCVRITPGPGLPRLHSYAIRKMALYSCSPVMLNVYDVSNDPRIQTINNTTKTIGYGGVFHAAIEIQGKEYSFGGTVDKKSKVSGVFQCAPKQCPMHHYRESVFLGDCELSNQQVQYILMAIRPNWLARSYNIFRRNCTFFSRELAIELGVGDIPEWVFSLATTAETIEPYLRKLNAYLRKRTKAILPDKQSPRATSTTATKQKPNRHVSIDTYECIEAHEVAKITQEALLDHAMAARIQRSFRASKVRRAKSLRQVQTSKKRTSSVWYRGRVK